MGPAPAIFLALCQVPCRLPHARSSRITQRLQRRLFDSTCRQQRLACNATAGPAVDNGALKLIVQGRQLKLTEALKAYAVSAMLHVLNNQRFAKLPLTAWTLLPMPQCPILIPWSLTAQSVGTGAAATTFRKVLANTLMTCQSSRSLSYETKLSTLQA